MNSVFEVFQATAGRCPDAPFLCVPARPTRDYFAEGAEFSYRWMLEQALQTAQCYAQAGYGSGHRVALLLDAYGTKRALQGWNGWTAALGRGAPLLTASRS